MEEQSLKQRTKKGLYWKFFDQMAGQAMQFVIGIVMARLLSPEDFGIAALPAVFVSIASIFTDSGFAVALIRKQNLTEDDLSTSFYYSVGVGILMFVCLFVSAPFIADFYDKEILTPLVRITALNFLWGPISTPQQVILQKRIDFKTPARISIVNKFIAGVVGISVAYAGYGIWALIISSLTASLLGVIQIWISVKWLPNKPFSRNSFNYLWNYGNKIILARFIDTVYSNITPIIIGKFYNTYTLGLYDRANGYARLPANQLGNLLMSVTLPVLSKMQENKTILKKNYRKMIRVAAFIDFPIFILLCALARPFILILITDKWDSCIVLLQILCLAMVWWPIHSINTNLLQVIGRSDLFLKVEVIKKICMFIVLCFSIPFGIKVFCWGIVLQNVVALIANTYYTGKLINYGIWNQLKDISHSIIASIMMFVIVYIILYFVNNLYVQLIAGLVIGGFLYLFIAYIFKFQELEDIKSFFIK